MWKMVFGGSINLKVHNKKYTSNNLNRGLIVSSHIGSSISFVLNEIDPIHAKKCYCLFYYVDQDLSM
jgi:hypothetical protein